LYEYNKSDQMENTEYIYIAPVESFTNPSPEVSEKIEILRAPIDEFVYNVLDDENFRKPWIRAFFTKRFTREMLIELLKSKGK